ncbi:hypothetical protein PspTeo4_10456 [Pseudomonas sp. Teo4]|nr:hypothetical protein [Pseudomonas sp. Teo4]
MLPMEELLITNGALEALNLCLQAVTEPGDLVAIEAPAFYACLQVLERLKLKAVEIPVHPREGMDLGVLAQTLDKHPVKAVWCMTNFQNPIGASMPKPRSRPWSSCCAATRCRLSKTMSTPSCTTPSKRQNPPRPSTPKAW